MQGCDGIVKSMQSRTRQSSSREITLAAQLSLLTSDLPSVRLLTLVAIEWELFILEDVLHVLSNTLPYITELHLSPITFRTFIHGIQFICAFPLLRRLSLRNLSWDSNSNLRSIQSLGHPIALDLSCLGKYWTIKSLTEVAYFVKPPTRCAHILRQCWI